MHDRVAWVTLPLMTPTFAPICALAAVLALGACGTSNDELTPASAQQQAAGSLAADLAPLHAEAVQIADVVLGASPDAGVAEVVGAIRGEQAQLRDDVASQSEATAGTPGALAVTELDALRSATGDEAVRRGLDALLRNHLEAVSRAKAAVVEGAQGAERALADRVLKTQGDALLRLSELT